MSFDNQLQNHMTLDKELYRRAFEYYRQWNEAELVERVRETGKLSPQELWERYAALWEFCVNLAPEPTPLQEKLRQQELEDYYAKIQKFEAWRRKRAKRAKSAARKSRRVSGKK